MGTGGALEAAVEARAEGLTRYIGVTGHGWTIASMQLRSLERFDFDSVLLPWNYVMYESERYREDFDAVCALCEERDVAVQTIKSVARGPWATAQENRNTWYQPFEDPADIEQAVHWVLARPRSLPQHRGRSGPAAGGARSGKPIRNHLRVTRRCGHGHRIALRDAAIRDRNLTVARDHAGSRSRSAHFHILSDLENAFDGSATSGQYDWRAMADSLPMNPFQPGAGLQPGHMGRRQEIEDPLRNILDRLETRSERTAAGIPLRAARHMARPCSSNGWTSRRSRRAGRAPLPRFVFSPNIWSHPRR